MIIEFILNGAYGVIALFAALLPSPETLPEGLNTALSDFATFSHMSRYVFPVGTFFLIFGLFLANELILQSVTFAIWVAKKLRLTG